MFFQAGSKIQESQKRETLQVRITTINRSLNFFMLLDFMLKTNVSKKVQLNRVLSLEGVKVMIIWRCGVETPKKSVR